MKAQAIKYATEKHSGQVRKVSGKPYITHPIQVMNMVEYFKKSKHLDELLAAAVLHDTLEDTSATFVELATEFSPMVASIVLEVTSDKEQIKLVGKTEYLKRKMLGMSSYGLLIKLCDRLSNVSDSPAPKTITETKSIIAFLRAERKLSKTHERVINQIELYL